MDCTQVLESDELNDSLAYKYKVKVAELKVNDNLYPIFSGSNRIGRDPEFCSVVFNNMTLSKEHAVIEVEDRFSHLIYDLGSKNKTRVGKTILKPHIRYQLLDKSQILLGDLSAEYFIIPEEQENKPFAVIQESDDEVIPDTPVQMKSRESKESSSSREESPTIFEMETQLGYIEPCVKTVQDPGVPEGNLVEGSHPEGNENKESSTAGASNSTDTAATSGSEVNICESNVTETTAEVNHSSDGDETDPEDVFFAMTQKRDVSLLDSSDAERTSELKETVENGQPKETHQIVDNSSSVNKTTEDSVDNTRQQSTEKAIELPCSSADSEDDVSRGANQIVVPEEKKIRREGEENNEEKASLEKEVHPEATHITDSVERSGEGSTTFKTVMKEHSEENENKHLFKQPLPDNKEQKKTEKTAQVILSVDEEMPGERIETVDLNSEEDDSFFNAATQVLQPESQVSEVLKTPLIDAATKQETNLPLEGNEPCNTRETNEESRDQECDSEIICDAPVQAIQLENRENSSGAKLEVKEQVLSAPEDKLSTCNKDDEGDSDSTTDDESSFFNAPTQIVHTENEHTDSRPSPGVELGKPTCSSVAPDKLKTSGKDEQEKEEIMEADDKVKKADDFIFTAPTQVLQVKRKEGNISSEKDIEPHAEQNSSTGSSIEGCSENDSIFDAPTQLVIHSENLQEDSLKSSGIEKQPEKKEADQQQRADVSDSETDKNDSIYEAETQVFHLGSESPVTFTTSTPAKKKSVTFVDDCDRDQSVERQVSSEDHPKPEGTTSRNENETVFDGATKVVEPGSVGSSSSKEPSEKPKPLNDVPAEENEKRMSECGKNNNQEGSSSESKFPNSPQIHPLDDSDDSIFSAPTQIISRPSHLHDATSPRASTSGKLHSSSLGTEVVPEADLQIAKNNEEKTSSEENVCDASRKEEEEDDTHNDSFFEAATQLYTSSALSQVDNSDVADDKANQSLSRSSSYSSIHEAPTQCMDDLVLALDSDNVKESVEKSGQTEETQKKTQVAEGTSAEEPLQVHEAATAGAVTSLADESLDLVLPSSQELKEVGQEFYGCASDDEKPSTSNEVSSPVIQKRTRSIPFKKGILMAKSLDSIKSTVASGSGDNSSDNKAQPDIESTKLGKLPKDKNGLKKTAGKKKAMAAKGKDKSKKITEYLESNNSRDKSAEKEDKYEENKAASDENEKGRPSRQRKPTWKARESTEEGLLTPIQKTKKGDTKEQSISKVSPGSSKQTKKLVSSLPKDENIAKEDQNRKETSKLPTKMNTESCVNSESKPENNVEQKKSENLDMGSDNQRNIHVHSLSSPQSEDEKTTVKKGVKSKRSLEVIKSKTIGLNTSSSPESCSSDRRAETSADSSSSKRRRTLLPMSDSDQDVKIAVDESRKGTNVPSLSVEPKAEEGTTRSRRKPINISDKSNEAKHEVSPLGGSLQKEEANQNKRGRPKRSTTVVDMLMSGTKSVSKPALGKTHHDSSADVDRQENEGVPSSSIEDKSVNVGKRGRPRHTTTPNSASSSDAEVKSGKKVFPSGDKQTESKVQGKDDKSRNIPFNRSKRSATNSTSSSEVEIISEKTKEYSLEKEKENSVSPSDKLDVKKRGRPKRSVASRGSSVEIELKPMIHNKRTQNSDICDTPTKERKISVAVSSSEQDEKVDAGKRGRAKRSAKKAFGLDKEINASDSTAPVQRLQGSDICDTPRKQRRNHVPSLESDDVELVETNRRGRSKRSATPSVSSERETCASSLESSEVEIVEEHKRGRSKRIVKKGVPSEKETGASSLQSDTVEIIETNKRSHSKKSASPRVPLKRESGASLGSGEVEIIGTNERGRSKKAAVPNVPLDSKEELTPITKVKSDKIANPTSPPLAKQRRTIVRSGNRTPNKANDASEPKLSRGRKKGVNVVASDEDQSMCGSPSYGSTGRKRKVLSQASSTEVLSSSLLLNAWDSILNYSTHNQGEGTPKRSSRIKHHAEYHIMFTGVGCSGADEAAIKKLGGKVVQEPEECTILITDKIRRTFKFLCIMGHGKPIVTPDWIKQSHLSGSFLDPWNFIVKDKEAEKKFKFQLQKSLKEASAKKLLDGYSVFATPSVKPPPTEMKGVMEAIEQPGYEGLANGEDPIAISPDEGCGDFVLVNFTTEKSHDDRFKEENTLSAGFLRELEEKRCIYLPLVRRHFIFPRSGCIVENCGGQFLTKDPSPGKWPEKSFIISAVDDKKLCNKFKKSSVPIVSVEILLTGILQQKLNISDYILKL
ncbi:Uncharacterized protein GBIM_15347 [Gryllus bimaculatus]|nr:Uncharacterized protein GBIM_15347 [Gryllus bimaculatus]